MHQIGGVVFLNGLQLPACCVPAERTTRPDKPGQRLSGGGAGRGWSGHLSRVDGRSGAAAAAEDGGGGARLLAPRLLRAHLPFGVLRILA